MTGVGKVAGEQSRVMVILYDVVYAHVDVHASMLSSTLCRVVPVPTL